MKKNLHINIFFFALIISFVFAIPQLKAQTNNLPTQAEINTKLAHFNQGIFQTPLGTFDNNRGVMVTGAEQNCINAIPVCAQSYSQTTSYTGHGTIQEVNGTCLLGQETNSVWYVFTAQTTGTFGFTLVTTKDYDFALYDITTIGCAGIPTATPVRCNFSATLGNTGMSPAGACSSCTAAQGPFSTELAVTAGQTYALIIDNWSADATGYTLNFTTGGGYASITDVIPPTINPPSSVVNNCNGTFTLAFSEPIQCSTIAANGSDFTLTGGGVITGATGVGCSGSALLTNAVTITYTVPSSGTFTLGINQSVPPPDGNTILDKCGNAMLNTQTVTLNTINALTITPSISTLCAPGTVNLTVGGAPNNFVGIYSLNPGGLIGNSDGSGNYIYNNVPVNSTTTFVVSATFAGCTNTASTTITVATNVVVTINPVNPTVCSGNATLNAYTTVNGLADASATFLWQPGNVPGSSISGVPGTTYSVTTTSSSGCPGSNTATSTPSIAVAGANPNCSVYYVSTTGVSGGTHGLTKADPTTLQWALAQSLCTSSIIKMQVGIYTLTDKVDVNSFITIEGGFNAGALPFTIKTSDMSGGPNSTTIRRTNAVDSDDPTSCSAFKVAASADDFRFQDLRIEMPGSPNVTGHINGAVVRSNYGIKIGAGSTGYNIVRCYINAGAGSNP